MRAGAMRLWTAGLGAALMAMVWANPSRGDGPGDQPMQTLKGTVWYRERMLLPPNAQITVRLEDAARMDVAAEVVATTRLVPHGAPPYSFELGYDPARIEPRGRYVLRARIEADGELLFTNTSHVPAFEGEPVEILVSRVSGSAATGPVSGEDLIGVSWRLVDLDGEPASHGAGDRTVDLMFDESGRVSGFGGCNRYMGGYEHHDDRLSFSQLASTMMACPEGMDLEQRFLRALAQVSAYRLEGGNLALLDGAGKVILRFEAWRSD